MENFTSIESLERNNNTNSKHTNNKKKNTNKINNTNYNDNHSYIKVKNDGRTIFDLVNSKHIKITPIKSIIGFVVYFFSIVILIPTILFKYKYYDFLEAYMPNIDLIANLLAYRGGPLGNNLFIDLYSMNRPNIYAYLQTNIINYMALLGIGYIIARETHMSKNIPYGWSMGIIMFIATYLLPAQLVTRIMNFFYNKITPYFEDKQFVYSAYIPSVLIGTIITAGIIYVEKLIITYNRKTLFKIADFILKIHKKI